MLSRSGAISNVVQFPFLFRTRKMFRGNLCTIIYYVNQLVFYFIFIFQRVMRVNSTKNSSFRFFMKKREKEGKHFPIKIFNFFVFSFQSRLLLEQFFFAGLFSDIFNL